MSVHLQNVPLNEDSVYEGLAEAGKPKHVVVVRCAASSISAATSLGCDTYTAWLAPATSTLWLCARSAYMRSRSGLMVLSSFATRYQLGFSFQAGLEMGVVNTLAAVSICACAMNSACSRGRSAAKSAGKFAGSRNTKPSGVLINGLEALGNFLPLAASVSPSSGACAAMYTRAATWESVPASVMTAPP